MIWLTKDMILELHTQQISLYGGRDGILDNNLFESLCAAPYATFGGNELYPTILDKAVKYLEGFAGSQAFVDGNKRIGVSSMIMLLALNNIDLTATTEELTDIGLRVANHDISTDEILLWLYQHIQFRGC